jgi:cobalt-precorrin 5A hydrolase
MGVRRPLALLAITRGGARLAARVAASLPDSDVYVAARWRSEGGPAARALGTPLGPAAGELFAAYQGLVFFTAVGVAVRLIAPHLRDKRADPAVVAVDESGRFAVAVLGGHGGGANDLAARVAAILGATPVVTTASEARGVPVVDLLGREHGWRIEGRAAVKATSAALVNGEPVGLVQDAGERDWWDGPLPAHLVPYPDLATLAAAGCPGLVISDRLLPAEWRAAASRWVICRPRTLVLGIGASRGVPADEVDELARAACAEAGFAWASVRAIATLDRKLDEPGLLAFAAEHDLPLHAYTADELRGVAVPHPSPTVQGHVGTPSVCEAAAMLAAGGPLVLPKRKSAHATVAIARRPPGSSDA